MCIMGLINGRLIEVLIPDSILQQFRRFGLWQLNGGSTVCALCLPHPSVYPALQHAVLPPHNRPAVKALLKFFNIITSVN